MSVSGEIAEYLFMLFRVCGRFPRRRTASYGRQVACRGVAMVSGFTVRAVTACVRSAFLVVR
jgi:hypothetical protein